MEEKRFKSVDEYSNEFDQSGEKNFYEFLERKKQEALEAGDPELVEHIETIYNKAYEEEQQYYDYLKEEYDREEKRKREELEVYDNDYDEYEEALRNVPIDETPLDEILHRKKTPEELENMTEEELQQIIVNNDQTIEENNTAIKKKKALIEKVLAQQETIAEQETEINRLNIQKKEL